MVTSLAGLRTHDEQDYPLPIRDAVTPLPFHAGGTTQLLAGTTVDLVKVSELRRFESADAVVIGTHTGAAADPSLTDDLATFGIWGVVPGDELVNVTQTTTGVITASTTTTLTTEGQTWDVGDEYSVNKRASHSGARPVEIRKFSVITDQSVYIRLDGVASDTIFDAEVTSSDAYFEENIRVVSRISVRGVSTSSTPTLRWTAWGI